MAILSQTKTDISHAGGTREGDAAIPGAINTGAALVLILVTGSSKDPVDFRNIGHGCNLPISRRRLQRDFNRAVLETKIGFLRTASNETVNNITQYNISDLWAQGVIHPESKRILSCIDLNMAFNQQEVEQLDVNLMWMQQNLGEMLRGPSSPKSQDTRLSLINPHYYQTKDSSVQLLTESMDPSHCYFKQVGS